MPHACKARLFLEICLPGLLADDPRHGTVWAPICNSRNVWPTALQPESQTPVECKTSCRVMCGSVAHSINQFVIMRPRPEPTLCFGQLPWAADNFCICLHCFRCRHFSLTPLSYVRCARFSAKLSIRWLKAPTFFIAAAQLCQVCLVLPLPLNPLQHRHPRSLQRSAWHGTGQPLHGTKVPG